MPRDSCVRSVCVVMVLAAPAAAQTTTEDGIRAMLSGDHPAALRILRPLADDAAHPDPVAQFFLAVLYETGQGVRNDMQRACGLFLRSAAHAHPFAEQSAAIAANMQQQLGDGASMLCVANERWQGGPPLSFDLGPGHRIVFADTSVTVTHGEQEQRGLILATPGTVIQYTPIDVKRPLASRRHFFQWFQWMPSRATNTSSWALGWALSEVVGDQWISFKGEKSLIVVDGPARPESFDFSRLVRLGVNENGEAELTMLGGAASRTEVIPPQGSR